MTDSIPHDPSVAQRKLLFRIWVGLLALLFVLAGVGLALVSSRKAPPVDPKMILVLQIALGALSLATAVVIFGLLPYIAKRIGYFLFTTLRWAFSVSIGLYGLVLFLLGATRLAFFSFLGGSLLLLLLLYPSEKIRLRFAPSSLPE
ncbi:MAG: hypothetical protein EP343_15260 [Deltaproteobacteria bacterium]|nr:MAG: hypothetical protein EP343_15260 [Deltaproteobacteria bacterium]